MVSGELVTELTIRTMDMLRMMNHGIQYVCFSTLLCRNFSHFLEKKKLQIFDFVVSIIFYLFQLPQKIYNSLDFVTKKLRFTLPFPMLAYPIYLVGLLSSLDSNFLA